MPEMWVGGCLDLWWEVTYLLFLSYVVFELQVPLNSWVVMVTKRDYSKAYDFVEMMKKVCPSLGINVSY